MEVLDLGRNRPWLEVEVGARDFDLAIRRIAARTEFRITLSDESGRPAVICGFASREGEIVFAVEGGGAVALRDERDVACLSRALIKVQDIAATGLPPAEWFVGG